jgi:hypothetical protein
MPTNLPDPRQMKSNDRDFQRILPTILKVTMVVAAAIVILVYFLYRIH